MGGRGAVLGLGVIAGLASLLGCGGSHYETAQVSGVVRLDGAPLANVRVEFVPDPTGNTTASTTTIATATTGTQGEYQLHLPDGRRGAPVGWHRVVVADLTLIEPGRSREEVDEVPAAPTLDRVPDAYRFASRTPLRIEVQAGSGEMPLDLYTVEPAK